MHEIGALERIGNASDLWDATLDLFARDDLDTVIYLTVNRGFRDAKLLTNLPILYDVTAPEDDPFLLHCCDSYQITRTGAAFLDMHPYLADRDRQFIRKARTHGFESGLAVPVQLNGSPRFGGFNLGAKLSRDAFLDRVWPKRERLRLICLIVHRRMVELADLDDPSEDFRSLLIAPDQDPLTQLSPREREIVFLLARGLARKECARLCGISPNTADDYIKSAYRKLGVHNRAEVIRLVHGG